MKGQPAYIVAGCFAISAFAVALMTGLINGIEAGTILWRAIIALILCYPAGFIVGMIAQFLIDSYLTAYKNNRPVPDSTDLRHQQVERGSQDDHAGDVEILEESTA